MTPNPWQCQTCGETFPVQDMARRCEARHRAQTEEIK